MTILAIDFGTSNTVVALGPPPNYEPVTLELPRLSHRYDDGPPLIPSLVYVESGAQALIGNLARQKPPSQRLLRGFKRDLSQQYQAAPAVLEGRAYTPQVTSQIFLERLVAALHREQVHPSEIIFSAPVGAYETYLRCLRDIATQLEIPKVRFIDESTAAALGYGISQPGSLVLVVDIGGGTLDLSLVRILKPGEGDTYQAEVLAKTDRAYGCGGLDVDTWIAQDVLRRDGKTRDQIGESSWQLLVEMAEKVKVRLSQHETAKESFFNDETFETLDVTLTRDDLERVLEQNNYLGRIREAVDEVLELAFAKGVSKKDIQRVLLVGGSTLIPAVRKLVSNLFGTERVAYGKPFEAVAHGALSLTRYQHLNDHLRHTYALRLYNPFTKQPDYEPLFKSGTGYPAERKPMALQANHEGMEEMALVVGELGGEGATEVYFDRDGMMQTRASTQESSFRPLGQYQQLRLKLNPPGRVGVDRLAITFAIDAGRNLRVSVRDMQTQQWLLDDQVVGRLA